MDGITTLILALSLAIIMFGMGLSLTPDDFNKIFVTPKAILIGLVNQLVILPIIGFVLITVFPLKPEIAIGVIILAACPGGATSNLITQLAGADVALSVSLTAISSFLTLLTIPVIVNQGLQFVYGENTMIQLNILTTILQIFGIVIIPISIGMIIRGYRVNFADRMEKPMRRASGVVFMLVLVGIILKEKEHFVSYFEQAGSVTIALNLLTMSLGLFLGKLFSLNFKQKVSIIIESGIQNGTLALAIATILLKNTNYAIAPATYSLIMFISGGIVIFWSQRKTMQ